MSTPIVPEKDSILLLPWFLDFRSIDGVMFMILNKKLYQYIPIHSNIQASHSETPCGQ